MRILDDKFLKDSNIVRLPDSDPRLGVAFSVIEVKIAGHRNGYFRQLIPLCCTIDTYGDTTKQRRDFEAWFFNFLEERTREWAVAAGAIDCNLVRLCRIGHDHAAGSLDSGQSPRCHHIAACRHDA